jgi:ankyrin repeat protein
MQKLKKMMMEGMKQNDLKKVAWALNLGLDINALLWGGFTPLHLAIYWNKIEFAKLLIDSGADVNAKDYKGDTLLQWVKSEEMKALLKQHGAI